MSPKFTSFEACIKNPYKRFIFCDRDAIKISFTWGNLKIAKNISYCPNLLKF